MFIQLAKRFHENKDGSISVYPNYRLMKAYRDTDGKPRKRPVLSLGALEGMADADRDIRPVYHKTDDGIKAHLNLAVLAYWVCHQAPPQGQRIQKRALVRDHAHRKHPGRRDGKGADRRRP